ncbi:hypothetical protein [Bacteroides sp.]
MSLESYSYLVDKKISFTSPSTACWRGDVGYWLIENSKLYLTDLEVYIGNYQKVGIDYLFPGGKKVLAEWFFGKIRIPHGEIYTSRICFLVRKGTLLGIEKGFVVDQYEIVNTHLYNDKAGVKIRNMDDLIETIFGKKTEEK